jgi:glycosyltransferase involved in cell wall biosynthesis
MGNIPKVSVIIPTYNSAPYLPEALDSVLSQSYQDFEIILVDDGSKDSTKEVIRPYLNKLTYLYQDNKGSSSARNLGLNVADGDYLVFLDADDILFPDKLCHQVRFLDSNPDIDVVYSNGYRFKISDDGREYKKLFSKSGYLNVHLGNPQVSLSIISIHCPFPLFTAMARRETVEAVGGFDEELMALEDWDLWYRVANKATFYYLDILVGKYRQVPGSITDSFHRQSQAKEKIQIKIEASDGFKNLSLHEKANVYFYFGIQNLYYRNVDLAMDRFTKARFFTPLNIRVNLMYISTFILGYHTIKFYFLKRWLFGPHQKI